MVALVNSSPPWLLHLLHPWLMTSSLHKNYMEFIYVREKLQGTYRNLGLFKGLKNQPTAK